MHAAPTGAVGPAGEAGARPLYPPAAFVHAYPPQRVHHRPGLASDLGPLLAARGIERAMVVCGRNVAESGLVQRLFAGAGGRIADVYPGVRPHPPADSVDVAARYFAELRADALVSIGGGSSHDVMRGIALCASTGRPLLGHFPAGAAFVRLGADDPQPPPMIAIPSTFSAAEVTYGGGVVAGERKLVFVGDRLYVGDIVLDREVFGTTPLDTLLSTSLNAMSHAVGRLFSPRHQPIGDAQFLHALRLLTAALPRLARAGVDDHVALSNAIVGAHLSASTNVLGGIGHAIAHVLGGRYGTGHGIAHGITMPRVMRENAADKPETVALAAEAVGLRSARPDAAELEHALVDFIADLGLPTALGALGIQRTEAPAIATDVLQDISAANAARPDLSQATVERLLARCW